METIKNGDRGAIDDNLIDAEVDFHVAGSKTAMKLMLLSCAVLKGKLRKKRLRNLMGK